MNLSRVSLPSRKCRIRPSSKGNWNTHPCSPNRDCLPDASGWSFTTKTRFGGESSPHSSLSSNNSSHFSIRITNPRQNLSLFPHEFGKCGVPISHQKVTFFVTPLQVKNEVTADSAAIAAPIPFGIEVNNVERGVFHRYILTQSRFVPKKEGPRGPSRD